MKANLRRLLPLLFICGLFAVAIGPCAWPLVVNINAGPRLARKVRSAATAEQWQAWRAQMVARGKTNSAPLPPSEWPTFVSRVTRSYPGGWVINVEDLPEEPTNTLVHIFSPGGFGSIGVVIGPPSYIEFYSFPSNYNNSPIRSWQAYPGIYVRQSG